MESNEGYICPACKKLLRNVRICGVELEACIDGCGGIWFDAAELFRLDEPEEGAGDPVLEKLISVREARGAYERSPDEKLLCIKCGAKMKKHEYREGSNIFIDECYACGGIWLDGGELKAIRENPIVRQSNAERAQLEKEFSKRVKEETENRQKNIKPRRYLPRGL